MKLTVGLGAIDDYEAFTEAGADECFLGYVPGDWMDRFGESAPLNRREVLYYNVQIGSYSELLILRDMVEALQVPVSVAMNAIHLTDEQIHEIPQIVEKCLKAGIHSFIVADERLVSLLTDVFGKEISLHISGEYGDLNSLILDQMARRSFPAEVGDGSEKSRAGVTRIIFPRQTSLEEMEHMIEGNPQFEYEAFLLNEKCHFTGAYCNSMHCDELCHACKIPYQLSGAQNRDASWGRNIHGQEECPQVESDIPEDEDWWDEVESVPGETGCGLCNLWRFREMGITHLKLVSRGNDTESTLADIRIIRRALDILDDSESELEYQKTMMQELFPKGCSQNCYQKIR